MSETPYRILVVDDNDLNRDLLVRQLERKGYEVLTASDGRQALQLINLEPVDPVFLDIMMPGMSGIEVLRKVRKTRSSTDLPIMKDMPKCESMPNSIKALDFFALGYALCSTRLAVYLFLWHHFKIPLRGRVLRMFGVSSQPRLATATPKLIIHI